MHDTRREPQRPPADASQGRPAGAREPASGAAPAGRPHALAFVHGPFVTRHCQDGLVERHAARGWNSHSIAALREHYFLSFAAAPVSCGGGR